MAQLTLAEIRTRVQEFIPDKATAAIDAAANHVIEDLAQEFGNQDRGTFTTLAKYTTGTVSVNQDSASVTGSGTSFDTGSDAYLNGLIQIQGDDAWFGVTAIASATALTLSSNWAQSNVSGGTFVLVQPRVTLPAAVLRVNKIWRRGRLPLTYASDEKDDWYIQWDEDEPLHWSDGPFGTSGEVQIQLRPYPDARYVYEYSYMKQPTLLSASGDAIPFPSVLNTAVLAGTLSIVWDQEDAQDRSMAWLQRYEMLKRKARAERLAYRWGQADTVRTTRRFLRSAGDIGA